MKRTAYVVGDTSISYDKIQSFTLS